ncbi:MAG: type II CAAX endopeptidase family protein [Devosia sp.]
MATEKMKSAARSVIFVSSFLFLWTVAVVVVWRVGALPDEWRPVFRALFWFGAVGGWLIWTRPQRPHDWLGLWPFRPSTVVLTVAAFVIVIWWNVFRTQSTGGTALMPSVDVGLFWGLLGVVEEELVFRGAVQSALAGSLSAAWAISLSSGLFLAVHFPGWIVLGTLPGPETIGSVLLIGLACGALRYYSRSLYPAIGAHWANNLGATL